MSVPAKLVAAAAEALGEYTEDGHNGGACQECRERSTAALQAAFAKLGECEAVREMLVEALEYQEGSGYFTDAIFAALAREFGGRE